MQVFYEALAEILEVDEVKSTDVLEDFENWDSLTVLSILAMLDANYGVNITSKDIQRLKTIGELAELVSVRKISKHD